MARIAKTAPSPVAPPVVPYFSPAALTFLRNLTKNNDREWFQPRKATFDTELKEPMLAIVRRVTDAMLDYAPQHVRPAEKSLFRIYRDTRFSNDKRPYKTHIAAWWSHTGLGKTSGAGYYFHVGAKEVVIAAGAYMPEKEQLASIRNWLLENHEEFRKLVSKPAVRKLFTEFDANALTRPPKGFPVDHPALDLIKCRQWGLSATLPVETALDEKLAATVTRYFKLAAPMVDALNTPLVAALQPKKKVLFGLGKGSF